MIVAGHSFLHHHQPGAWKCAPRSRLTQLSSPGLTGRSSIHCRSLSADRPRRTGSPACAGDDGGVWSDVRALFERTCNALCKHACNHILAAPSRASDASSDPLDERGRRECRVKASPMARLRTKCRRQVPQVQPINRHSLRDGLNAYTRSPRCPGLLATVALGIIIPQGLSASVGAPGPRDFTSAISRSSARSRALRHGGGHRIPPSTFMTIAKRPPHEDGTRASFPIFGRKASGKFPPPWLNGGRRLIRLTKMSFACW